MPLINCSECSTEISSDAISCPHCGVKRLKSEGEKSLILIFLAILVVAGCIVGVIFGTGLRNAEINKQLSTPVVPRTGIAGQAQCPRCGRSVTPVFHNNLNNLS